MKSLQMRVTRYKMQLAAESICVSSKLQQVNEVPKSSTLPC